MPELPEVETVRRGLVALLGLDRGEQPRLRRIETRRADLRRPFPAGLDALAGGRIAAVTRRAKYLLIHSDRGVLLNHLGMTGSWRLADGPPATHDHLLLHLDDGRALVFRDPRRFGVVDLCPVQDPRSHPDLAELGPEPLDPPITGAVLRQGFAGRRQGVKPVLLDQRVLAGVGNIYAAEACFRARIHPETPAGSLSPARCERLAAALVAILGEAIAAGGSTISDFRQAGGGSGYFQHRFQVYERDGQPCLICGTALAGLVQAGRSTVFCPRCQRR